MIRKMGGDRREWEYPVITSEEETAISDREKAELLAKAFAKVHSVENLTVEGRRRREINLSTFPGVLDMREDGGEIIGDNFTMAELVRAVNKAKLSAPGGDQVSYVMLKNLGPNGMAKVLQLYNRYGRRGNCQVSGKKRW